jgi:hypothetical protein
MPSESSELLASPKKLTGPNRSGDAPGGNLRHSHISPSAWFGGFGLFGAVAVGVWGVYAFTPFPPWAVVGVPILSAMATLCLLAAGREYYIREGISIAESSIPVTPTSVITESSKASGGFRPGSPLTDYSRKRELEDLELRKRRAEVAEAEKRLAAVQTPHSPQIAIDHKSKVQTYVQFGTEEEYEELEDYLIFRSSGGDTIRRLTIDPFTILGDEHSVEPISALMPDRSEIERRVRLEALRKANIAYRAFHRTPIGVPIVVRYYGSADAPQHLKKYAIVYEKGKIRVDPIIVGDRIDWIDVSGPPPHTEASDVS